jgi:hypothetical protein
VTTEYRHRTLTPTYLAEPRRGIVLGAKMIAAAPMGLAYGLAGSVTAAVVGGGMLTALGEESHLASVETLRDLLLGPVALMAWAMIGVGFGALIRSQVAAIVVLLVFNQFVEPIARSIPLWTGRGAEVTQFLPGAAGEALAGSAGMMGMSGDGLTVMTLPEWAAGLVMLGYAAVLAFIGYAVSSRRDVT